MGAGRKEWKYEKNARALVRRGLVTTQGVPYIRHRDTGNVTLYVPQSVTDPTESIAFGVMVGSGVVNIISITGELIK